MGKETHSMILKLGGKEFYDVGFSDHEYATADIEAKYFNPWKKNLWLELTKKYLKDNEV